MKVGNVTERSDTAQGTSLLDTDELDRTGIDLGATGRLLLMSKLAEGVYRFVAGLYIGPVRLIGFLVSPNQVQSSKQVME